jgi:SAM-dependent methyltransferase
VPAESSGFRRYLEAKFAVDSASLNPRVAALFRQKLCAEPSARVLDLGTGTGAMLRRLLELPLRGETLLVGLDRDARSLAAARRRLARALQADGKEARQVKIELVCGDILEPELPPPVVAGGFRAVTAHAVLDLLPLVFVLRRLRPLLRPGGLLYATLNYDGVTTLLPPEAPGGVEQGLLAEYDRSMERRRAAGMRTGGALSGRRLYGAALEEGFTVLAVGPSDWCLFPYGGRYSGTERVFLQAMLGFIAGEGEPRLPAQEVRRWHARRQAQLHRGHLALVVHQLDLLLEVK